MDTQGSYHDSEVQPRRWLSLAGHMQWGSDNIIQSGPRPSDCPWQGVLDAGVFPVYVGARWVTGKGSGGAAQAHVPLAGGFDNDGGWRCRGICG